MSDAQTYVGNNHVRGPGFHMNVGNPSFILKYGNKQWRTEWHYHFGPSVLTKNGDLAKNQPSERSPFWLIAQWWRDQGCVVIDGVGQWKDPPVVETRARKVGRQLIVDAKGDVVIRHWQGYEKWPFRRLEAA